MTEAHKQTHDRVSELVRLSASPEVVWRDIGGFDTIAAWHPLIASADLSEVAGDTYRHLTSTEGERFFDRLIETGPHHITYEMVESPFPMSDCRATLSCVAEETGCHVFWSAHFVPDFDAGDTPDKIIGAFYRIGLSALLERYG